MIRTLALALALGLSAAVLADDKDLPKPHVSLTFDGEAKDSGTGGATVTLKNTEFKDKALMVNGIYPKTKVAGDVKGADVRVTTPKLAYDTFTAAVRFRADEFGEPTGPLKNRTGPVLVGGTSYRWFHIGRNLAGNLEVTLNNNATVLECKQVPVAADKWYVVACSVSVPDKKVVVAVNGKAVEEFTLPKDFVFEVAESKVKEKDKVWTTVNYSFGTTFKGLLGGLVIYDTALNAEQLAKIPLKP